MGRSPSFDKGLKKGPWTSEEDGKLVAFVEAHGHGSWSSLPIKAGLQRCGKSCRLRWTNYLRPDIKRGKFSLQEEKTIIQLHALLGNRWSAIATYLPKRTDNEIKNYWNTHLKKQLTNMGIDPITHKSRTTIDTNLCHMTQWENARLEAEARFVRGPSRVVYSPPIMINKLQGVSSLSLTKPVCFDALKAWQGVTSCKLSNLSVPETLHHQTMPTMANLIENGGSMSFQALESLRDKGTRNTIEVSDMIYQDDYLNEPVTNHLVKDANNGSCDHADFEDDKSYWSRILDILGSNSSFSYIF